MPHDITAELTRLGEIRAAATASRPALHDEIVNAYQDGMKVPVIASLAHMTIDSVYKVIQARRQKGCLATKEKSPS